MNKAKAKADRHIARQAAANSLAAQTDEPSEPPSRADTPTGAPVTGDDETQQGGPSDLSEGHSMPVSIMPPGPNTAASRSAEAISDRMTLLRSHDGVVNRFITCMVPILVDVYAASVSVPVRIKSLTSMLKAISFQDEEHLKRSLLVRISLPSEEKRS